MGEDGRDNECKDLLRLFEGSGYEGEGWWIGEGEWKMGGCTWIDIARVGDERWGNLIEGGGERGVINLLGRGDTRCQAPIYIKEIWITRKGTDLCDLGGVRGVGKVNEPVPNEDTDVEGVNGEYLRTLEGVDGVSLLAKGVTLGDGGRDEVAREFR